MEDCAVVKVGSKRERRRIVGEMEGIMLMWALKALS